MREFAWFISRLRQKCSGRWCVVVATPLEVVGQRLGTKEGRLGGWRGVRIGWIGVSDKASTGRRAVTRVKIRTTTTKVPRGYHIPMCHAVYTPPLWHYQTALRRLAAAAINPTRPACGSRCESRRPDQSERGVAGQSKGGLSGSLAGWVDALFDKPRLGPGDWQLAPGRQSTRLLLR